MPTLRKSSTDINQNYNASTYLIPSIKFHENPARVFRIVIWGQTETNGVNYFFATFRCAQAKRLSSKFVFINETDGINSTL
jgi:hypothetical protein